LKLFNGNLHVEEDILAFHAVEILSKLSLIYLKYMSQRRPIFYELSPPPDVLEAFESVLQFPYPILFDSATAVTAVARYSFVTADPGMVVRAKGWIVDLIDLKNGTTVQQRGRALDFVAEMLDAMQCCQANDDCATHLPIDTEWNDLPPFHGGAAGYIGYEYSTVLERLPKAKIDDIAIPDVVMGLYDWVIAWDHVTQKAWVIGNDELRVSAVVKLLRDYTASKRQANETKVTEEINLVSHSAPIIQCEAQFPSTFTATSYAAAVQQVQQHITTGEIFQANLSQRFHIALPKLSNNSMESSVASWELYKKLRSINPAPFASYFDFGDGIIASASPERFLLSDADGKVETRPIKGTRSCAKTEFMDAVVIDELLKSEKDAAEHVMIVDVLRNDLSRVCIEGSVHVPSLMAHERYATVHHLVSTIVGQLRPDMNPIALLHACFPGGSITGAPKIRAMEIIAQLEPVTRGPYCGTMAYLSTTGAMDTSILIRTYVIKDDHLYFAAGGGIVADSDPPAEYIETLVKAKALMQAFYLR
jgi:para-aminobenzoate synthetase component 1